MGFAKLLELAVYLNLLSNSNPPTCNRIECPSYDVIKQVMALKFGITVPLFGSLLPTFWTFLLFKPLIMASRSSVMTQVSPSDGLLCESSFVVSFYVPKENQADPPPAEGLHIQNWGPIYVAVRQFSGFVSDYEVAEEVAALDSSLAGSKWAAAIQKTRGNDPKSSYIVAQYNSPFEFVNRVNEIWFCFDTENAAAM